MIFDVVLEKGTDQIPRVKISVVNSTPKLSILIEPQSFLTKLRCVEGGIVRFDVCCDVWIFIAYYKVDRIELLNYIICVIS